jgi:Lrp/AsnC family transcriptional regulator, regulator for asnA, asnC and gidA
MAVSLDDLDVAIIHALQKDGRTPFDKIASQTDVSSRTISARVNRLVESGVIDIIAVVNPEPLGYPVLATVFIETEMSQTKHVADVLAKMEEVAFVGLTSGDPEIYASVRAESNHALSRFMTEKLPAIRGIRRSRMLLVLDVVKAASKWCVPKGRKDG